VIDARWTEQAYIGPHTDESDRASAIEAIFNEDALRDAKKRAQPETHPDFDGTHCVGCGEEIPAARLELSRIRCVECQDQLERRRKLMRV
jgi:RNA polymerase-binding transcription factor DksA